MEDHIKDWVDRKSPRHWVYYRVQVGIKKISLGDANPVNNMINASLICTANKIAHDHSPMSGAGNSIKENIVSTFQAPTGAVAAGATVITYRLDNDITTALRKALDNRHSWNEINEALQAIRGFGAGSEAVLLTAYENAIGSDTDLAGQLNSGEKKTLTWINNNAVEIARVLSNEE